jgi:hypothetical protein
VNEYEPRREVFSARKFFDQSLLFHTRSLSPIRSLGSIYTLLKTPSLVYLDEHEQRGTKRLLLPFQSVRLRAFELACATRRVSRRI